jgi:hypothetical protein
VSDCLEDEPPLPMASLGWGINIEFVNLLIEEQLNIDVTITIDLLRNRHGEKIAKV